MFPEHNERFAIEHARSNEGVELLEFSKSTKAELTPEEIAEKEAKKEQAKIKRAEADAKKKAEAEAKK